MHAFAGLGAGQHCSQRLPATSCLCRSLPTLRRINAVKALIECALRRKGSPASRNAGIAAAKLAQDEACLEQLRECNGLDIIYSYVKP
jgi:hypothetical protein